MTFEHVDLRLIPGLGNDYFINRDGQPYSRRQSGRLRPLTVYSSGRYRAFKANGIQVKVHVAILLAFVGPRPTPEHEAMFKDGNRANITLSNLAWGLRQDIVDAEIARGVHYRAAPETPSTQRPLTDDQVQSIRDRLAAGETQRAIARDLGVNHVVISNIFTGLTYRRPAGKVSQ